MSKVITYFAWSEDGYTTQKLKPGDERDFGEKTDALIELGFIEAPKIVEPSKVIVDEIDSNGGDTGRQPRPNNSGKRKT
jgi:hypothetical protein